MAGAGDGVLSWTLGRTLGASAGENVTWPPTGVGTRVRTPCSRCRVVENGRAETPVKGVTVPNGNPGLSRAQITRLITRYGQSGEVRAKRSQRRCFPTVYTPEDVLLLATVDEAHETLSGPATQKILQRQFYDFQDQRFPRLAGISMAKYTVCARASGIGNCG